MPYEKHKRIRVLLGSVAGLGALCSICYCWLFSQGKPDDVAGLVIVGSWTILPPLWFLWEYWGIDHDWIKTPRVAEDATSYAAKAERKEYLQSVKDYADYASKIWAAVLAVLVVLTRLH
jgi:hypothetical protein